MERRASRPSSSKDNASTGGDARRSIPVDLASPEAKAETSPEVDSQGGVSHHFFVTFVESVFDIQVAGHVGIDLVPAAEVDPSVSRGMLDAQA